MNGVLLARRRPAAKRGGQGEPSWAGAGFTHLRSNESPQKLALRPDPWVDQDRVAMVRPGSSGRRPPRASIARPMSASGDLKPKAIRCSSRILVLVDSMSAFGLTVDCTPT